MINLNICLSDLPKAKITEGKDGKKYVNLVLWENREPDKFGNTHSITVSKSKEEKDQPNIYVGNGKSFGAKPQAITAQEPTKSESDDLPF